VTRHRAGALLPAGLLCVGLVGGTAACSATSTVVAPAPATSPTGPTGPSAPPASTDASPAPTSTAGPIATSAPQQTPSAGSPAPTVAATSTAVVGAPAYASPPLSWTSCEGGLQCAQLTVPLDYAAPAGRTLRLALIRTHATGARLGSLVVNPGGPGGSGYDFVRDSSGVFSDTVRARFDIVGFDPRGVGKSSGIDCTTDGQLDAFLHDDPVPDTQAARDAYTRDSRTFAANCGKGAQAALLPHVGTVEAARDLDVLRAALGEAKLTYFGYSYGTYLGATYAQLFPTRVRAAVLDGPLDPGLDLVAFVQGQAMSFDLELDRWFAWCTAANGCGLAGSGGRTVQQRFDAVEAGVRATPLVVGRRSVGAGEFSYGVAYAMYSRSLWPQLATAMVAAEAGDGAALLGLSDSYTERDSAGHYPDTTDANYAVNCLDHRGPRTEQAWADAAKAVEGAAPRLGAAIVYNTLPCAYWPVPARPALSITAAGAPPILVIGTTHDPATPYAWAKALAGDLASGVLLTRDGDGHTAYGPGAPCVVAAADRYLVSLAAPAAGTRC